MPHRFHTTSTNRIIQLAGQPDQVEFQRLREIDRQLQNLILNFNLGVEGSFSAGGMQGLKDCCTAAGLVRMQEKYSNWAGQQVAALNMVSCDFLSFDLFPEQNRARVFTFEKWVFVYADGRQAPTEGSVDGYDVHLVDGQWRVDSVKFYAPNPDPH
jgi:hypothetical protein